MKRQQPQTPPPPPPTLLSLLLPILFFSLAAAQQSPLQISPDGTCGNGVTCAGSTWGQCCSPHFYCGSDDAYCGSGCNPTFGLCSGGVDGPSNPAHPSSSPSPSAGVDGVEVTVTVTETVRSTSVAVRTSTVLSTRTSVVTSISVVTSVSYVTSARDIGCVGGPNNSGSGGRSTEGVGTTTIRAGSNGGTGGSTAAVPGPTLPGVVSNCKKWYETEEGDTCRKVARRNDIERKELYSWNPSLAKSDSEGVTFCAQANVSRLERGLCRVSCDELWVGYFLCVGV